MFLTQRFFAFFGLALIVMASSYRYEFLFEWSLGLLAVGAGVTLIEAVYLFAKKRPFSAERIMASKLSLGDDNLVSISLENNTNRFWRLQLIDELPFQFQERGFSKYLSLKPKKKTVLKYQIHPVIRGEYHFGDILLFIGTWLHFVQRRVVISAAQSTPVYPSIIQMKKYSLLSIPRIMVQHGVKKNRRIGHSFEFEQIRSYVRGDDIRSLNWKATARANTLMVNQYQEEKSQQIYCLIDRSRVMKMPFNNLSLLDYAINAALVISNVSLQKGDKAGLISYSEKLDSKVFASHKSGQLARIMNALYKEEQSPGESDYEKLFYGIKTQVNTRSLLFMFTNFESLYALHRVLNVLRRLNKAHLLVVIFFKNSELADFVEQESFDVKEVYYKTAAEEFIYDKEMIVRELNKHSIQTIYTKPEDLSINVLNKYLELKARGLI